MAAPRRAPSLAGSIVRSVLFLLLCGIVGPIFLVLSFVMGDLASWMRPVGIGLTALVLVIGVLVGVMNHRARSRRFRLTSEGTAAQADIRAVESTSVMVNNQPLIRLSLRVHGPGVPPFDADVKKVVPLALTGMLHRGVIGVWSDPATREFDIDWQLTGLLSGSVPFTVTDTASGRTYELTGQADTVLEILQVVQRHGLGPDSLSDLRSHPAARAEVMRLVHARAQQAAPASAPASATDRFAELDRLWQEGRMTEEEYHQARQRILGSL